jgi:hypothetical protein
VTGGAGVRVFEKTGGAYTQTAHFVPFKEYALARGEDDDGYEVYSFTTDADRFHYTAGGGDSGFLKTVKVEYFDTLDTLDTLGANEPQRTITIDVEELDPSHWEDNGFKGDGVYFNVNDAQHLVLNAGETFRLIPMRVWQAMDGFTENYFIEPDYHTEVLGDSGAVSAKWSGSPGLEYSEISGLKPGTAILRVTYGPLRFNYDDGKSEYYNAIDPINTGVAVVTVVDGDKRSGITTGISAREYDTIYFDRAAADHAGYSFTPAGEGEPSVRVHRPIHGETEWGGGWSAAAKNHDGSFTVKLYEGRNVVEVSFTGSAFKEYHVINARGIAINVSNETNPAWRTGEPLNAGDRLEITFDGIRTPLEKIAGIYNPGFPDTCYVVYRTADGGEIRGEGTQYNLSEKNGISVTVPESGNVELVNGVINCGHMGYPLGDHRTRPGNEPVYPNFTAVNVNGTYSVMPDIVIPRLDAGANGGGGGGGCGAGAFGIAVLAVLALAYRRSHDTRRGFDG